MTGTELPGGDGRRREVIAEFAARLRALRAAAGNPSFRAMAGRSGRISHTTLHECVSGVRLPSWETTREFVRSCGGDEADWGERWSTAATATTAPAATPPLAASPSVTEPPVTEPPATKATVAEPPAEPAAEPAVTTSSRRRAWVAAAVGAVLLLGGAAVLLFLPDPDQGQGTSSDASTSAAPGPRVPGDATSFIGDVTIPDDTVVAPGQQFTKVWEIVNRGTVLWRGRYLQRTDLPPAPGTCATPDRVQIGDTLPNERIKISVAVTAPTTPTTCMVKWKMVDEAGEPFFPSSRPIYFLVRVQP
ncbi:NBR1-Ig-like domain-containing protein [Actinosynnema sp. NPDC050436]|uniref:NBR1-Ig-like domain-containing protein n=1 Tax=Actinosynnema sp. NPDC050436 TaxID=3155659 RepID=UPI0033DCDDBB